MRTKLTQITVLEASKMKQKSFVNDGVHLNEATVKNVKRYQPVKNAYAVTKFRQLGISFKIQSKTLLDYSCSENFCRGI